MVQCESYPNLLANTDRSRLIRLHVDDMLVAGEKHLVTEKLLGVLKQHYKVSCRRQGTRFPFSREIILFWKVERW